MIRFDTFYREAPNFFSKITETIEDIKKSSSLVANYLTIQNAIICYSVFHIYNCAQKILEYGINASHSDPYIHKIKLNCLFLSSFFLHQFSQNLPFPYYYAAIAANGVIGCIFLKNYISYYRLVDLSIAAIREDKNTITLLHSFPFKQLCSESDSCLPNAIMTDNLDLVQHLVELGSCNINRPTAIEQTALMLAVSRGHEGIVRYLIEKGANVNASDKKDYTALHIAAQNGNLAIARQLIENGADIDKRNNLGLTALHMVIGRKNTELVSYLLNRGANRNTRTCYLHCLTPLHYAARFGNSESIALLRGADVEAVDYFSGYTPLHHAAETGNLSNCQALIALGANPNTRTRPWVKWIRARKTALELVDRKKHPDVYHYLRTIPPA